MILKALSVILLLGCSGATHFEYEKCLLVDLTTDNVITFTDENGTATEDRSITFNSSKVQAGTCHTNPGTIPNLILSWDSGAVFQLYFTNTSGSVKLAWQLQYTPDTVFQNGDTTVVTHSGDITAGHTDVAYVCNNEANIDDEQKAGNNSYKLSITFSEAKWQAFNVEDGKYSAKVEECGADETSTENPTTEKPTEKPTTAPKPTSEHTTKKENLTTEHTVKPTTEHTKPTEKPTTEHTKPTEKPTTEGPTSAAPTSPTTTAAPSADPVLTLDGQDSNGTTCVVLKGKFLFSVNYPKNGTETGSVNVGLHDVTKTTGDCGTAKSDSNKLMVEFFNKWEMVVEFSSDKSSTLLTASDDATFWWSQVNLTYTYDDKLMPDLNETFNGKENSLSADLDKQFKASQDGSYKCTSESDVKFPDGSKVAISELQYMAFSQNKTAFPSDNLSECSGDSGTSSVVPIAVGAALAGLVVIVLIAYLIGRKRNRKGYESV